jgi:hypothetical protein
VVVSGGRASKVKLRVLQTDVWLKAEKGPFVLMIGKLLREYDTSKCHVQTLDLAHCCHTVYIRPQSSRKYVKSKFQTNSRVYISSASSSVIERSTERKSSTALSPASLPPSVTFTNNTFCHRRNASGGVACAARNSTTWKL